jgi:hypothetical protein
MTRRANGYAKLRDGGIQHNGDQAIPKARPGHFFVQFSRITALSVHSGKSARSTPNT